MPRCLSSPRRRRRRFAGGGAGAGQLLDSPGGRANRVHEIDAAWQQLWRDQYTSHVPESLRAAFDADYRAWQKTKEGLADLSALALMGPATDEALDRWTDKASSWNQRFRDYGVEPTAPALERATRPPSPNLLWAIALGLGAVALIYGISRLPVAPRVARA